MALTQKQLRHYLDEGYLLVKDLIDHESIDLLSHDMDARVDVTARRLHAQRRLSSLLEDESFETRLAELCRIAADEGAVRDLWKSVALKYFEFSTEAMFRLMTHPAILDVVEQIIGPEIFFHPQSNVRAKLPLHEEGAVAWHQDSAGLDASSEKTFTVNFWIPLVDVTMDMGGMQVMGGRHHNGSQLVDTFSIPDDLLPKDEIIDCPVPRGGVLMIQKRTIHRSVPNVSNKARWSMDFRYCRTGEPTGRPGGFVVRSRANPGQVITTLDQYLSLIPEFKRQWASQTAMA